MPICGQCNWWKPISTNPDERVGFCTAPAPAWTRGLDIEWPGANRRRRDDPIDECPLFQEAELKQDQVSDEDR